MDEQYSRGTAGDALATTNSSASTVTLGANNTQTFDTGGRLKVTLGNTNASLSEYLFPPTLLGTVRLEGFEVAALGGVFRPLVIRAGASNAAQLGIDGTGRFNLRDRAGTVVATAVTPIVAATRYDIEVAFTIASPGVLTLRIYAAGASTPTETLGPIAADTGAAPADRFRVGTTAVLSGAATATYWVTAVEEAPTTAALGPAAISVTAQTIGTVEAGADMVVSGTVTGPDATLTATSTFPFTPSGNTVVGVPPLTLADTSYLVAVSAITSTGRTRTVRQYATVLGCDESITVGGTHVGSVVYFGLDIVPDAPASNSAGFGASPFATSPFGA